ncbi:MYXO-CTERM sorting domain-containing protein, partial [Polyangium sp. 6x1]|uniref:MYXO-CTERM sorting domain-containing protein n=1 Tax=Polyangium sp. 6x1 TaxID=3042689 RepID=UPI002482FF06
GAGGAGGGGGAGGEGGAGGAGGRDVPSDEGCGCRTAGAGEGSTGSLLVVLGALGLVIARRRKAA